jgi:virginiamycin B lyase
VKFGDMPPALRSSVAAFLCVAGLAACFGGASVTPPRATAVDGSHRERGRVVLRIRVPKHRNRRARYVSSEAKSMTVAFAGPTKVNRTLKLTPGSNSFSFMLAPCPTTDACYTGTIATYDANGHLLSSNQQIAFAIAAGATNSIPITLDGVPASVTLTPTGSSTLSGSDAAGFSISKCVTSAQPVVLAAYDIDGEHILGAGEPTLSIASKDPVHLVASAGTSHDSYSLVPPSTLLAATIPNAHTAVAITLAAKPPAGSGIAIVTRKIDVTFDATVCGVVTPYGLGGGAYPNGITAGPDGAMWFTEPFQNRVVRMTVPTPNPNPSSIATPLPGLTNYPLTAASGASPNPQYITSGSDGNLWFTDHLRNSIWRMTTSGSTTEYANPSATMILDRIASAHDGSLWFAQRPGVDAPSAVGGVVNITTTGAFSAPVIIDSGYNGAPGQIVIGPDENEWFDNGGLPLSIDRVSDGSVTAYPMPSVTPAAYPGGIATGADLGIWFSDLMGGRIFRMNTSGSVTNTYTLPAKTSPGPIVAGPDGALYFIETLPAGGAGVGRITTSGAFTLIPFPSGTGGPTASIALDITTGPDGAIWVTEEANDYIVRIQ